MVITWMQIFNNKKPCEFLTQVTEYVSPDMLLYDDKILHFWKVFAWMVQFSILLLFHNVRMPCTCYKNMPYYTMSVWHVEECRCTQVRCTPQLIEPVLQSCTTPCQFDMWKNTDVPRSDSNPPITTNQTAVATEPYYTMSVWHVEDCRCTQVKCTAPANWIQVLLQSFATSMSSFTCGRITDVNRSDITPQPPLIKPQCYRALLYHVSLTCWKNAGIPRSDVHSPLFEPSATELYYTMSVWYVTECRCT